MQIQHWKETAAYDAGTAELLIKQGRLLPGLFFCHLTIEKIIKAHVVKATGASPPRTHNLTLLLTKTGLQLPPSEEAFLGVLMVYQMEGRYPAFYPSAPDETEMNAILEKTILLAVSFWPLAIGPSQQPIANSQQQMDNLSRTEGRENLALQSINPCYHGSERSCKSR